MLEGWFGYRETGEELRLCVIYSFKVKTSISSELLRIKGIEFFFLCDYPSSCGYPIRGEDACGEANEFSEVLDEYEEEDSIEVL